MDQRVLRTISVIQENVGRNWNSSELAALVNLSESRLRHLMASHVGLSLNKYLRRCRLKRAQALLAETHLSVKQVMAEVGIRDASHFARDFRQAFGVPPTHYRVRARTSIFPAAHEAESAHD